MTYRVALSFEDGVTHFITCAADQTVADASYRHRINIPLDCRDGACGTCKARCDSGDYDGGNYIDDALTAEEAAAGYVLPCSMRPRSDLVVQIASTSTAAKAQATSFSGTITSLDHLSPTTVRLAVEITDRDKLAYLPGQYVNIAVPGTEHSRSYSFSNALADKVLTFLIKITPGGAMSSYLEERAEVGDKLSFTGPNGSFFLRESEQPVLLLAGGTGLAPMLAILRSLRDAGSPRLAHLVYGVSSDDDLAELDTLRDLSEDLGTFTWEYCVSDPDSTAPNKGYVTTLIREKHLYDGDVAVYLCGPPPMVDAVRTHFTERGVSPTGFYYEKFAPSGIAASDLASHVSPVGELAARSSVLDHEVLKQAVPIAALPVTKSHIEPVAPEGGVFSKDSTEHGRPSTETLIGVGRDLAGQHIFTAAPLNPLRVGRNSEHATTQSAPGWTARPSAPDAKIRMIAGQRIWPENGSRSQAIDRGDPLLPAGSARAIVGQQILPPIPPELVPTITSLANETDSSHTRGYEIGEEHPPINQSDAVFEAREALELGALDITIGRLNSQQLAGYRLLAESTLRYVNGDRFTDAAAYTEANAAFHDYLFTLTGNTHLLEAYRALGVRAQMEETLRNATWCHPRCARDHIDIVAAFEAGDRQAARRLISDHAERSKQTMRRAMVTPDAAKRLKFLSPGRFDNKVVVVTGAAQGIGEFVARRIASEGGSLLLVDRSELVNEVAADLTAQGRKTFAITADLESWEGAERLSESALAHYGRIDVLINNVGGAIQFKPFTEFSAEEIQAEITRSLMTTLLACRATLPTMVERGQGVVVNVSSVATRGILRIPYSAAKGGINALTASLAMEYANSGIRVVATAPGGTEAPPRRIPRGGTAPRTDRERQWFSAHVDQTLDSALLHRYGTLDEQAAAIAFLASDEASYITGTVLPVGGGDLG
ncbi:benzoate 1,2-dioxygenase electron transfer component BenC [Nocardia sp. NPDC001965]